VQPEKPMQFLPSLGLGAARLLTESIVRGKCLRAEGNGERYRPGLELKGKATAREVRRTKRKRKNVGMVSFMVDVVGLQGGLGNMPEKDDVVDWIAWGELYRERLMCAV
jgi:hypothetical protein